MYFLLTHIIIFIFCILVSILITRIILKKYRKYKVNQNFYPISNNQFIDLLSAYSINQEYLKNMNSYKRNNIKDDNIQFICEYLTVNDNINTIITIYNSISKNHQMNKIVIKPIQEYIDEEKSLRIEYRIMYRNLTNYISVNTLF